MCSPWVDLHLSLALRQHMTSPCYHFHPCSRDTCKDPSGCLPTLYWLLFSESCRQQRAPTSLPSPQATHLKMTSSAPSGKRWRSARSRLCVPDLIPHCHFDCGLRHPCELHRVGPGRPWSSSRRGGDDPTSLEILQDRAGRKIPKKVCRAR